MGCPGVSFCWGSQIWHTRSVCYSNHMHICQFCLMLMFHCILRNFFMTGKCKMAIYVLSMLLTYYPKEYGKMF